tara:strand:+ start:3649 stop:7626 length:3978 start_codon:yes stop_codon:yes gene_type:complete
MDDLESTLGSSINLELDWESGDEESTETLDSSEQQVAPTGDKFEGLTRKEKFDLAEPGELIPGIGRKPREGVGGLIQDTLQNTAEGLAPGVGLLDTVIDTINFASPKGIPDIPKIPEYEAKSVQAVRNISGLIIPSLGLRSMAISGASKLQAAGGIGPAWLKSLGNRKSFEYLAKFGIDIGTSGLVDYVAEQNQKDDNFFGTLKKYWPKTFQFIPNSIATNDDDTPGEKRAKNVNEGAIFGMLSSIVEGVAYLTKAGRSVKRTSKFVPSKENGLKNIDSLTKDEFSDIKFSENPVEDQVLRGYARKEKELNLLNEYYVSKGEPPIDWNQFDETETLVRTKDADGIYGAMADAAQIQNNIESAWGRIGNIIHEAARKEGIEIENLGNRTLVRELTQQIKEGGDFSKTLRSGTVVTKRMIDNAGKKLAATLLHPRVEPDEIIGLLDSFKRSVDESAVRIVGKKGIKGAIKQLKEDMLDLDVHKARAYLATSEAGQISDMSEGARLMEEGDAVNRAVDLMADRLEVLMVEKQLANFEANAMYSNFDAWKLAKETGDKEIINAAADTILNNTNSRLTEIIPQTKEWTDTIKTVARENPQFLKPLLLANEFTDGNVDSMFKLHQWAANNLAVFKKAIIDRNPDVPSIINKSIWSNLFNSMLSAMGTPMAAATGNLTGLIGKGSATVFGAVVEGDLANAKKAMTAHFALDNTLGQAFEHMKLVFRKASTNPKDVSYVMRSDVASQTERGLTSLRAYADSASAEGEDGAKMLLSVFDDLDAIANDPVLRFGGNAMTAFDGFTRSVVANTEAKFTAFNKLAQSGDEITETSMKKATEEIYNSWFDSNGMISNAAVDVATSEIALNANSPIVDGFNWFLKRFPAARSFIWFPKTTANVIDTFGKWSPAGILSADHYKMWGPLGRKQISEFSIDEITEILTSKGKPVDEFAYQTFEMLRYEIKGKAAIGSLAVTMAGFAALGDRCTGTGHYDKARQRQRIRSGWKGKTCKVPGTNKVVSYEWMGPIGDWLALTIDVIDNFDSLSSAVQEDLFNKLTFVLGSAITNRSTLSQLEPMFDVMQGNGAAASRWASSFLNTLVPLGGLRNELGKILYPQLRQIRSELTSQLRNRNAWLDAFDPDRALPDLVDPIDGKRIGYQENWFIRAFNRGPLKIHDKPSKERQFLIDIEFNSSPTMNLSQNGAVLENHEISAINSKIGEMGLYQDAIREIMRDANRLTYTDATGKTYKGFVNIIQAQRRGMIPSDILDTAKYANIYSRLRTAYAEAKRVAENQLDDTMLAGIRAREYDLQNSEYNQKLGDIDQVKEDAYPEYILQNK